MSIAPPKSNMEMTRLERTTTFVSLHPYIKNYSLSFLEYFASNNWTLGIYPMKDAEELINEFKSFFGKVDLTLGEVIHKLNTTPIIEEELLGRILDTIWDIILDTRKSEAV